MLLHMQASSFMQYLPNANIFMYACRNSSAGLKKGSVPMTFIIFLAVKVSFNYRYFKKKTTFKQKPPTQTCAAMPVNQKVLWYFLLG